MKEDTLFELYCERLTPIESPAVQEIIRITKTELQFHDMLSGRVQTGLIILLLQLLNAKRVLEIGMFTGYTTLRMAEVLPEDGMVLSCEYNKRYIEMAQRGFAASPVGNKIYILEGYALDSLSHLTSHEFDFIYIDADKDNYPEYFSRCAALLRNGGMMLIDNMWWHGEVMQDQPGKKAQAILRMNHLISEDERFERVALPIRDGLYLLRKNVTTV